MPKKSARKYDQSLFSRTVGRKPPPNLMEAGRQLVEKAQFLVRRGEFLYQQGLMFHAQAQELLQECAISGEVASKLGDRLKAFEGKWKKAEPKKAKPKAKKRRGR